MIGKRIYPDGLLPCAHAGQPRGPPAGWTAYQVIPEGAGPVKRGLCPCFSWAGWVFGHAGSRAGVKAVSPEGGP